MTISLTLTLVLVFGVPLAAYLYLRSHRDRISGIGAIARRCPCCHEELPRFRLPKTARQLLWGGWTCRNCGNEINRHGVAEDVPQ